MLQMSPRPTRIFGLWTSACTVIGEQHCGGRLLSDGTRTTADNSWLWVVTHSLGSWRCRPLSVPRYCRELRSSLHGDFRLLSALFHFSCSLFSTLRPPRQLCRNEAAPRRKTHSDLMRHATSPNPKTLRHKVLVLAGGR